HASACRCIDRLQQLWKTDSTDRFTQFSPLSFDYSLVELFQCWGCAGTLCVPAAADALVPLNFAIAQKITVWCSVLSRACFRRRLALLRQGSLPQLRLSRCGG